jgi:hypothetical protein
MDAISKNISDVKENATFVMNSKGSNLPIICSFVTTFPDVNVRNYFGLLLQKPKLKELFETICGIRTSIKFHKKSRGQKNPFPTTAHGRWWNR